MTETPTSTKLQAPADSSQMAQVEEDFRSGDALVFPKPRGGPTLVPATMNIDQAACYLGIAKATLYTWRTRRPGFGPRAVKAGGALRYRQSDLDAWIEAHAETLDLDSQLNADEQRTDSRSGTPVRSGAPGSLSRRSRPRAR